MANILNYITLSGTASSVNAPFTTPEEFSKKYKIIYENEKKSYLRHFIINNTPFFLKNTPILYEQLTQYLADKLAINPSEVKLIGSAKTGFSMSLSPDYGKTFGNHSDLDFSIINENLFNSLKDEYSNWSEMFKQAQIKPPNEKAKKYWYNNLDGGKNQIKYDFLDTHLTPNYYSFPITQTINNSLSLIKINLDNYHSIKITKATTRVYKNWASFARQLKRNTEFILRTVK